MYSWFFARIVILSSAVMFCPFVDKGQEPESVSSIFKLLESEATTDSAAAKFSKMGPESTTAKQYLNSRLSALIQQNLRTAPHVWLNSVHLAGQFQIADAIPSLVKWIGLVVGTTQGTTLTTQENLESFPAGKALAQIGDPAVPALSSVLNSGETRERFVACRALRIIGTRQATVALRSHLKQESDPELRAYIQKVTDDNR